MSRGLCLAQTDREAHEAAARLLHSHMQPILVEAYIPGRELAVSLLDSRGGVQVLPALEWKIPSQEAGMLTESFKLMDPADERHAFLRAELDPNLTAELEELSKRAFHALNLRDYARFDIRLSPGGSAYFLEANTTPSLEPEEALAVSAGWAGLDYAALVEQLLLTARNRYEASSCQPEESIRIQISSGTVELNIPHGVYFPPQSSVDLANLLDVRPGEHVLELGCGSGLLSIAAAKLGACRVVATDIHAQALQTTRENAVRNGVGHSIELRAGMWYEALADRSPHPGDSGHFDVIIATPPQTPGMRPFGPKYGGQDGAKHLQSIVRGAADFLKPEGRLWIMAISLANLNALWKDLHNYFAEASLVHTTDRPFTAAEYELMEPGLFDYLRSLRTSGISDFIEAPNGQFIFRNLFIRAANPRSL
jgi:methylase of polypeptide subunit release factors